MIRLGSPLAQRKVEEAVELAGTPDGPPLEAHIELLANNEPITDQLEGAEWHQSAIPITLDATIRGYLPTRMENARVELYTEIAGVPMIQVPGEKSATLSSDTAYRTDLWASSPGSLLFGEDAIKLGSFTEYPGTAPHSIVADITRRVPYNHSLVEIQQVEGVSLNYVGSTDTPGFASFEPAGAVLDRLSEDQTVGYLYRDTAQYGFKASLPKPMSALTGPSRIYHHSNMPDWLSHRPQPPLERYSAVCLRAFDTSGREIYSITEEVPYLSTARRPHAGRTLEIAYEDTAALGPDNARRQARRMALDLARRTATGETLLPCYDPLLERHDTFRVADNTRDRDGSWDLLWGMRVAAYKHIYGQTGTSTEGAQLLATLVAYEAILLHEERISAPTMIFGPATTGILRTLPTADYGVSGDDLYFQGNISWVAASGDDLIFYDNEPTLVAVSGDDIVVSK